MVARRFGKIVQPAQKIKNTPLVSQPGLNNLLDVLLNGWLVG